MRKLKLLICVLFALVTATLVCTASAAELGTVNASSGLRLRSEASTSSRTLEIVDNNTQLVVLEVGSQWSKVNHKGTVGYMATEYLTHMATGDLDRPINGKITGSVVNFRSEPNTGSTRLGQLNEGTDVTILGFGSGWYKIKYNGSEGYIHPDYIQATSGSAPTVTIAADPTPTAAAPTAAAPASSNADALPADTAETPAVSSTRAEVVNYAKQFLGVRYVYGGRSPSGFDCSGFVYYVFRNFGYTLTPGASTQMRAVTVIRRSELVPGDLVFFNNGSASRASHVGIYIGNNQFIHAVSPGKSVSITSLSDGYYSNSFVGGGRVLPLE